MLIIFVISGNLPGVYGLLVLRREKLVSYSLYFVINSLKRILITNKTHTGTVSVLITASGLQGLQPLVV